MRIIDMINALIWKPLPPLSEPSRTDFGKAMDQWGERPRVSLVGIAGEDLKAGELVAFDDKGLIVRANHGDMINKPSQKGEK